MSVSRLIPGGGANDFNVICSNVYTSVTFTKEFAGGAYTITSELADTSYDIYAYNASGTLVGYTNSPSLTTNAGFIKLVILGQTANNLLSFAFKETFTATDDNDEVTAGPVIESLTPTDLPSQNDTTTITGRNFATNATVTFSSTTGAYTSTAAKSVVRGSATSLLVTRPDNFPVGSSPYTVTVQNPGVQNPVGSNANIAVNSTTAGSAPVWVTTTPLPAYSKNIAYSTTLVATDPNTSAITYSIASGALPTGVTLTATSGVVAGTVTTGNTSSYSVTVRATDAGGNFVDRAFTIPNRAPTWNTTAGALADYTSTSSYSVQLSATDDDTLTYSVVSGTLPTGLTLSSSGLISGSAYSGAPGNYAFTVRVTDTAGQQADRAFTILTSIFPVGASVTFTAPITGRDGPSLAQVQGNCTNATIGANITVSSGVISFANLFPTGTYSVTIGGASGSRGTTSVNRGQGYRFTTSLSLDGSLTYNAIVGQVGIGGANRSAGGGGGTYLWRTSDNTFLAVAGGGGGGAYDSASSANGQNGVASSSGTQGGNNGGAGGTGGNGGGTNGSYNQGSGAAGAGILSDGASGGGGDGMTGGVRPLAGGRGGRGGYSSPDENGGFGGGGGGGNYGGGGGGGYSGGGSGFNNGGGGGGGGSYSIAAMTSGTLNGDNVGGILTITRTA
jgi:hypothetical protein